LRIQVVGASSAFAAGTAMGTAGGTAGRHGVRAAVTGTGYSIKTGEEPFYFLRLAVGTEDPVIRGSEDQLFKLRFALQTFVLKYRHNSLSSIAYDMHMLA
jgi:hypothetical protein